MDKGNKKQDEQSGDWAKQVPQQSSKQDDKGSYGWEKGESVLPEFRDPSVHDHANAEEALREHGQGQESAPKSNQNRTASEVF